MPTISQLRKRDASPSLVLVIVCAGVVLASLDLFIVNVALPSIARDLHQHDLASLSWILNGYAIVYAALLIVLGRVAESRPRQDGFLLGALVFTLASAACGAAPDLTVLVVFRLIQAVGAALLTPTSLGLILATAHPDRRQASVRAWTSVGGAAAALGPVVGGLLVALSWRWVFYVNVPIGLAAVAIGWRRLPNVPGHPVPRPDAPGAALVTAGAALLTLGLVQSNDWGWGSGRVIGSLAVAALLLGAFVLHTARHHNPLVDPKLFRIRSFTGSAVVALSFSTGFGAMLLSIVLWMQDVWRWSALHTGLAFAPGPLMVPLFGFLVTGRLIRRLGPGPVIGIGAGIYAAGVASWALRAGIAPDYAGQVLPGTLMTGIGVGLTLPTFVATGTSALPPQSFSTGSAVINMLRQVGLALGVAIFIAVVGSPHGALAARAAYRDGWWVIAGISVAAAITGMWVLGGLSGQRRGGRAERLAAPTAAAPVTLPE